MKANGMVLMVIAGTVTACGGGRTQLASEALPSQPPPTRERVAPNDDEERARREAEAARLRAEEEARARAAALERARLTIGEMIHFDYDQSSIRADARAILDRKLEVLRSYPEFRVRIEGHCDDRGSDEYNIALGNRRAQAVMAYLTARGIQHSRFEVVSIGEERPIDRQRTEQAWARNRRAEFHIIAGPVVPSNR